MKLYYLLFMFFLMSCERTSNVSECRHIGTSDTDYIYEYTINEHDYIRKGHGLAHSGTCKKCKQERDSVISIVIQKLDSIK